MARKSLSESDQILAAYLYACERLPQGVIAERLDVSPAVISRLLEKLKGKLFKESISFLSHDLTDKQRRGRTADLFRTNDARNWLALAF